MVSLPVAVWGRPDALAPGQFRGYQLLSCSEQFSEAARLEFEKLAHAVQWESHSQGQLPDAFLAWPFSDGNLIARVQDAGPDEHDRPHALRIVCALAPREIYPIWLTEDGWTALDAGASFIRLKECDEKKQLVHSIEVNDPSGALRVSQIKHARYDVPSNQENKEPRFAALPNGNTGIQPNKMAFLPALVIATVLLGVLGVLSWREYQAKTTIDNLKQDHAKTQSEMKSQLKEELRWRDSKIDDYEKEIYDLKNKLTDKAMKVTATVSIVQNVVTELSKFLKYAISPKNSNSKVGSTPEKRR